MTRETPHLSAFEAVAIAEGFQPVQSRREYLDAWQYLHDTGLAYSLQGSFGRHAVQLIDAGEIDA